MARPSKFFIRNGTEVTGPMTKDELLETARGGGLNEFSAIRRGDDGDWLPAIRVEGLSDVIQAKTAHGADRTDDAVSSRPPIRPRSKEPTSSVRRGDPVLNVANDDAPPLKPASVRPKYWALFAMSVVSVLCLTYGAKMVLRNQQESAQAARIDFADTTLNGAVVDAKNWMDGGHERLGERIETALAEALASKDVTERAAANEVLQRVKNRRAEFHAEAIRADGSRAVENGDVEKACNLFKQYIALEIAPKRDEVERFLNEAELAKSEPAAVALLTAMSPEEFDDFRQKGRIDDKQIQHPILQLLHTKTLQAATGKAVARRDELQAAAEQARLQAQRDEAARAEVAKVAMLERQRKEEEARKRKQAKEDAARQQREEDAIPIAITAFYNAKPSERFKHVVGGDKLRENITEYYQKNGNVGGELSVINRKPITADAVVIDVEIKSVLFTDQKTLSVRRVEGKWLVDWPATIGMNVPSFPALVASPPSAPVTVRVTAQLSDYYGFHYRDSKSTHFSIGLADPQGVRDLYGYVRRDSERGKQIIKAIEDGKRHKVTVSIGWLRSDPADLVEIVGFRGEHWFID